MNLEQTIRQEGLQAVQIEAEQVALLTDRIDDTFVAIVQAIVATPGKLIITGIGKSGHIGHKIAATFASTGTEAFFVHPAEALHGDLGMVGKDDTCIAISQSGETEEVLKILPFLKETCQRIIALTAQPNSTLAKKADLVLSTHVSQEACPLQLAPTSSTTVTLVLGDALAVSTMKVKGFDEAHFARNHPGGSLGRKLLTTVGEIMQTEGLPYVSTEASFQELILTMSQGRLGLAIVRRGKDIVGVVSDGDLRRAWRNQVSPETSSVLDYMNPSPKWIDASANLLTAENTFNQLQITTLLVKKEDSLVGAVQVYQI